MTYTNQKLREALQLIAWSNDSKWQADCARQALALPTASPAGEREAFEDLIEEFEAAAIDKHDCRNPEYEFEHRAYDTACQRYDTARAALSAGDAVDGVPGVETVAWMFTDPPMMGGRTEFRTDPENVTPHWTPLSATAVVQQYKEDAQRYRWLRDEAWAGYNQGKGFPHVFTIDGAGNRRTMLAEDALDASIDAAMRKGQL